MRKDIPLLRLRYTAEEIKFIQEGVAEILNSGFLTMSNKVWEFERLFKEYVGSRYAIAVNSGTSALEISLRSLGVAGKSVLVPTNTFIATASSVIHAGGTIIFSDVMKDNLSIDPDDLERRIQENTVGVIVVHIGGLISPKWDAIEKVCDKYNLFLIEDAAHAHGATYRGRMAGTLGIAAAFSFYPTKVFNTAEGGMITTDEQQIYQTALRLRDHGKEDPAINRHTDIGYNWRFSELHALLGIQQVLKAEDILSDRRKIASTYDRLLKDVKYLTCPVIPKLTSSSYYKYVVFLDKGIERDRLKIRLKEQYGVELPGEVYSYLCHDQPVFQKHPENVSTSGDQLFDGANFVSKRQICLPIYPGLTQDEIVYIVDCLKEILY